MAKLVINNGKKLDTIPPDTYGPFQSIWEDVSMKVFMLERIQTFQM